VVVVVIVSVMVVVVFVVVVVVVVVVVAVAVVAAETMMVLCGPANKERHFLKQHEWKKLFQRNVGSEFETYSMHLTVNLNATVL